jgi:hypothetical protein
MQPACEVRALPLFDPQTNRSRFPAEIIPTIANGGSVKRAPSQRGSNAFGTRARAVACLRSLSKIVRLAAMLASSTLPSVGTAHAVETSDEPCERSLYRLHRRGVAPLRCSDRLDTRGDARRKRRRCPSPIAQRRHGPDADHAGNLRRIARPLRSRRESV